MSLKASASTMDSEDDQDNEPVSEMDYEVSSEQSNKDYKQEELEGLENDGKKKYRREKGPPIVCLMCKTVWTKSRKGGRLFMFGGTRPFMAKFEAKFRALMGQRDLINLQNKSATKFGRSYICRECYLLVRQTYDSIRRIQRSVVKSIDKAKSVDDTLSDEITFKLDEEISDSDQDLDIQEPTTVKRKLPPVAERLAEKIANLKLVKINSKVPVIKLKPVNMNSKKDEDVETDDSGSDYPQDSEDNKKTQSGNQNLAGCSRDAQSPQFVQTPTNNPNTVSDTHARSDENLNISSVVGKTLSSQDNDVVSEQMGPNAEDEQTVRSFGDNLYSSKEAEECSAISLNVDTSFASQHSVSENTSVTPDKVTVTAVTDCQVNQANDTQSLHDNQDTNSSDSFSTKQPPPEEMAEILANPLLLIKFPQAIKLAEVKNDNVYICGEGGCDWIFSSKFFWENHIRHYHRSGKPFICPFEDCGRSFAGRSKLELHVRSHTDERPFICDKCGSGFRGNQELRAHRLTHTTEKPHQCPKCDKNFKLLSSLKRHLQYHDGGNFPYPCTYPGCEKAFKSRYDLKCHYRLHTGEKPYKCPEPGCGMAFRIPCQFTMHKRTHTGERPFRCTEEGCTAAYMSSNALQAHMLSHTSERPFCCEFCGKTFKHKMLYRMHLKKHTGPSQAQRFVCPIQECGEEHSDRRSINQHMADRHGVHEYNPQSKKVYTCPESGCGLKYSTDGGLRYHRQRAHKKEDADNEEEDLRKLTCPFDRCRREYDDSSNLHDHLTTVHMSTPREKMCPLCGLAFPLTDQLELHLHSFHNESSILNEHLKGIFVCNSERCGVRFHSLDELKHHVNWHLGNPPYRCEFDNCGRTFLLESLYSSHIRDHENMKPFTCSYDRCQEGFSSRLQVLKHSKVHYGLFRCPVDGCSKALQTLNTARQHLQHHEKPYVCSVCGKRFTSSSQWLKHKRSHTGEKVYECKICGSQFTDSDSLKAHKRLHRGEKRYVCEECGQKFNNQSARKNHMKTHSRELPFVCPEEGCCKAFRESASLKAHQNVHSKPSNLCSQCGKVYKFSVNKHKCKIEPEDEPATVTKVDYMSQQQAQPVPQQIPQSLPQALPQTVPQSVSQSISQSIPQSISQSIHQSIPQSISQSIPQCIPQSIPQSVPQSVPQSMPQPIGQPLPQPVNQTISQSIPLPLIQALPQPLPQTVPQSVPQPVAQSIAQSMPQSIPQSLPQTLPQTLPQPMPQQQPPQQYLNNVMMSEPPPQSYVMEVEEAARAMRQNFGAPDTVVVDPAYYNYIILYDRSVQQ